MNPRTTGILLLVAVLLGGLVWLSNRRETEKKEAEEQAKRLFAGVEAGAIDWIELRTSDGQDARLERRDGVWRVVRPVDFPADATASDGMASALAGLTSEGVIEDAQAREVYGLADTARVVRFGTADGEHELRVGRKTPIGANSYAATEAGDTVYTVASYRVTSLEKPADDLRERRPVRFDRAAVERVEVDWSDGRVVAVKQGDGTWKLLEPFASRADADTIETLLSDLAFLRATGFLDDPPPDAELGLDPPTWRVALTGAAEQEGAEPPHWELAIGTVLEDGQRVARGAEAARYRIPAERFDALPSRVVDFRFKELARFVATDAQRFELSFADPAAEGTSAVVRVVGESGEDGWTVTPEPMAPGQAEQLVAELSRLEADDIAADAMGPGELEGLGLDPPRATLRVLGAPAEEGAEAPELAVVNLGVQRGDRVYAQVPGRDAVYTLPVSFAEHVPISLDAYRNRFVSKEPPPEAAAPGDAGAPVPVADPGASAEAPAATP